MVSRMAMMTTMHHDDDESALTLAFCSHLYSAKHNGDTSRLSCMAVGQWPSAMHDKRDASSLWLRLVVVVVVVVVSIF